MNASVSALTREDEVQSKIRKVRTFGRGARAVCAAIFGFGLVGSVTMLLFVMLGPIQGQVSDVGLGGPGGPYSVMKALLTALQFKVCVFLVFGVVAGVWLAAVYQLYRLFGNLAADAIYTSENVRRVRNVGLLWLLSAVLGILIPAALGFAAGLIDPSVPINRELLFPSLSETLSSFVSAGLILLASWIMDVGLYEKDHADALQRDADLVI